MKLKHLKKKIWCENQETHIRSAFGHNTNKYIVTNSKKRLKIPASIRCPECGKSFKPRVRECHDANCWHITIPPHKRTIKVPRK